MDGTQGICWYFINHVANAIALSSAFDQDGVDVYFLNRPKVDHVKNINQLQQVFAQDPTDYCLTPLSYKVEQILMEKRQQFTAGNMVLVIATDGEPRSQDGSDSVRNFINTLQTRNLKIGVQTLAQIPVNIRACTNDKASIGYLNQLDADNRLCLDVTDDYMAELSEIQAVLGRDFQFSYGDYTLKCLLGASDGWMDKTDEPKQFSQHEVAYQKFGEVPTATYAAPRGNVGRKKSCVIQ